MNVCSLSLDAGSDVTFWSRSIEVRAVKAVSAVKQTRNLSRILMHTQHPLHSEVVSSS